MVYFLVKYYLVSFVDNDLDDNEYDLSKGAESQRS